ncbi:MAG: hypothetical protein AB7F50_06455 [Fimbriimonadaceae bacterium]
MTTTGTDPVCGTTIPYAVAAGWYGGSGTTGVCGDPPGQPRSGTVQCSGTVTITFTGTKDAPDDPEPPPPSVVVKRTSTAVWSGDGGTAENGLGHPALPASGFTQTSTGVEWTARDEPGPVFEMEIEPSAQCAFEVGGPSGMLSGSASVSLKAEAFPVRIQFSGTTDVGGPAIQVGQKLVSTVVGIPGEVLDDDLGAPPYDSYDWDEPPGNPFLDYRPDLLPTTFQAWADPGTPSMATYFGKGAPLSAVANVSVTYTIRCTVSLPRFDLVLIPSNEVRVYRPAIDYSGPLGHPRIDRMYLLRGSGQPYTEDPSNPDWMKLWGLSPPWPDLPGRKFGSTVYAWVQSPPGFGNELGQWN